LVSPKERSFLYALDAEVEKVESFYLEREAAMRARSVLLKAQLAELSDHRRIWRAANPQANMKSWANKLVGSFPAVKFGSSAKEDDPEAQYRSRWERPISVLSQHVKAGVYGEGEKPKKRGRSLSIGRSSDRWVRSIDPEEYAVARDKLKKAVIEHYRSVFAIYFCSAILLIFISGRGLETLNNYRVLLVDWFLYSIC
jgi:xenotropic and polytropic retrovirus receptor 1